MKPIFTIFPLLFFLINSQAQHILNKASLNEDGSISIEKITVNDFPYSNFYGNALQPFLTFGQPAFAIKNTRGVTLADLDHNGVAEILFGIDKTLYVLKGDGTIMFQKELSGPILLPPTVADLNGDGNFEILVNCGYPSTVGGIYLLDHQGNDMPGWPISFDGHWMINAPAVSDIDGDGIMEIVTGERVSASVGYVHVLKMDGMPMNENWPIDIGATPAFTPSIGDVNNDGSKNIVIAGSSSGMHVFNADGTLLPGFPVHNPDVSYSYQSPILVDLNGDGNLEIVGSNHGNAAAFYVMKSDGSYRDGWPIPLSGWTYSPSTVADVDGDGVYEIFMGQPVVSSDGSDLPTIFGFKPDGTNLDHFPIEKYGGNEGVITIADVNNDGILDVVFGSNITDEDGYGFLHAYSLDGSGEIDGFPLRPKGFTFLNGAVLGDVDNDGMMDLTVNSYTSNFGAEVDSMYVNTYNLNVPHDPEKIIRNGYKGSNVRDGLISTESMSVTDFSQNSTRIFPNPSDGMLNLKLSKSVQNLTMNIYDVKGSLVFMDKRSKVVDGLNYNLSQLPPGLYLIRVILDKQESTFKWIKK